VPEPEAASLGKCLPAWAHASESTPLVPSVTTTHEELLHELQPVAFAIAYHMLGSVSEAEDVAQEALLRVHRSLRRGDRIVSPRVFVATVTTRLAINELRSARARREEYVGEWLPEPIITREADDPAVRVEMADSLSLAMLVLLESLSPEQRAVLLLRDVFDYAYSDIAEIIGKSPDNVRQLATRARRYVREIRSISSIINPDKLVHLGPVGDFGALLRNQRDAP
jgi:RNA polymerase sigma factor (sigma-70 family)